MKRRICRSSAAEPDLQRRVAEYGEVGAGRPFEKIAVTSAAGRALDNTISPAISPSSRLIVFMVASGVPTPG